MKEKDTFARFDRDFVEKLDRIARKRIENGDKVLRSRRRLTKAITKWSRYPELEDALIKADMEDDRWRE